MAVCRGEQRSFPHFIHSLARLLLLAMFALLTVPPCRSAEKVAEEGEELIFSHNTA